jgi:hypothetical protein
MIEEGNRVAYAYVMANGIGAGLTVSPNYWFIYPQERVVEIGEGDKHAIDLGAGVSYRLNKSIKLGLSFSFKQHDLVKDDRVYSGMQNNLENYDPIGAAALPLYQRDGVPVTGYPLARITDQEIDYFLSQQVATIALTGAFVWPFTREFNVSVGAGPSINIINYVQHYDQILVFVNDGVGFQRRLYQNNFLGLGLKVDVGRSTSCFLGYL